MIEGEEEFILVREGSKWKVFLDWAAGVQVKFDTTLPANGGLAAQPTIKETIARSGGSRSNASASGARTGRSHR